MKVRHYLLHHLITICVLVTQYTILGLQLCFLVSLVQDAAAEFDCFPLPAIQPLSPNDPGAAEVGVHGVQLHTHFWAPSFGKDQSLSQKFEFT